MTQDSLKIFSVIQKCFVGKGTKKSSNIQTIFHFSKGEHLNGLEFVTQNGQFIKTRLPDGACLRDFL